MTTMNFKIFLKDDNGVNDVRRINMPPMDAFEYIRIKERLQDLFPNLKNSEFKITWKDRDGDDITITCDEDLYTAFAEMLGNVKILTIKLTHRHQEPSINPHSALGGSASSRPLVICDSCDRTVVGLRYKCLQCPDYDLCSDCEFSGCHSEHVMVRLPNNETYSTKCARKFMNHIARNLKKESYRSTKNASKCTSKCKYSENPSSSTTGENLESNGASRGCPFNIKDIHTLGTLVKENLTQILETIPSVNTAKAESDNNDQTALLLDIVRNAMDNFFGDCTQQVADPGEKTNTNPENTTAPKKDDPPSAPSSVETSHMETESTPQNEAANDAASQPQWTFVSSNNAQAPTSSAEHSQENQPKVAFIYHENPVIAEGLVKLHEMGFSNETGVLSHLLEHFNGNVSDVVKAIFDKKI